MRFSFYQWFLCYSDTSGCCWCYSWLLGWCVCVRVVWCVFLFGVYTVGKGRLGKGQEGGQRHSSTPHHPSSVEKRRNKKVKEVPVTCTVTPRDFYRNATNGLLASLLIPILNSFLYETSTTTRTMSHSHGPDGAAGGLHTTNNASQLQPQGIAQPPPPVVLTPALLESLKVSKIFKDNTQAITSIHFDDTGSKCVTSAADESLHVYDCYTGKYVSLSLLLCKGQELQLAFAG